MVIIPFIIFLKLFLLFIKLNFSKQEHIFPETYYEEDLIFPENDKADDFQYNLIEAKVLTKESITLYIKKQGINLDRDDCCTGYSTLNAWDENGMNSISDLEEIYSHAVYNPTENVLSYAFPVSRIENDAYTLYHKVRIFDKDKGSPSCELYFYDEQANAKSDSMYFPLSGGKVFLILNLTYDKSSETNIASFNGNFITLPKDFTISKINFKFSTSYSPAISFHWTYYKIKLGEVNFTLKGIGLCNKDNPCVIGYVCVGGLCERCHASCFDCKNGGLSTDCDTKCSPHSTLLRPDRGSCPLGYVDLSQFDSFTLEDLVPPTRNNRFTISFWMYLTSFPQNEVNDIDDRKNHTPITKLVNSFSDALNYTFLFYNDQFDIDCGELRSGKLKELNTWYFVKCANNPDSGAHSLFVKYWLNDFHYIFVGENNEGTGNGNNCYEKVYFEPEDYITFWFESFNEMYNNEIPFSFFIKQFVIFREYVQEPYDNKYFNYEKIFTSTFELPEVMFIIPFDELIRNDNKYDIKCYTYSGSILEYLITLTPYYYQKNYSLYSSKLFKRLNLLDRNKKYASRDLIKTEDVKRDNNTLIASYDYAPITCIDNYFLTHNDVTIASGINNIEEYSGKCTFDCDEAHSQLQGLSENKGFCNKVCYEVENAPICLSNNYDLLHLQSKFECKSGYYEIYYNCDKLDDEIEKNNVFYYNHDDGPANIVMDVIKYDLKSYIIEFWMYLERVDFCSEEPKATYYLFFTNQFEMKYINTYEIFYIKSFANRRETNIKIQRQIWNHFVFEVYYDPKGDYNNKTRIYLQKNFDFKNVKLLEYSENVLPLRYIYFCNGRKASCNNIGITWYCAFYRNLRLYDGNIGHRYTTFRYDEYYSDYKYLLSSIKFYYPLYGHYLANNLLSQYNSKDSALNTNSATNNWNFPQYAYCTKKDPNCTNVDNCEKCFSDTQSCYECKDGYFLKKEKGGGIIKCKKKEEENYYVLKLPSKANFKLVPLKGLNYAGATVNFYIKIYGFTVGGKVDIVYLGDNLKISYNSDIDSTYFGLNLVTFKDLSETTETVVSNYYDFRNHFGVWTFISVSTYDKSNENFFPPMVRFEINHKKMPIVGSLDYLSIGTIYFSEQLFALVQKVKVYTTYLIGTNSYETHSYLDDKEINYLNDNFLQKPNSEYKSYFEPLLKEEDCLFQKFDLIGYDKNNPDLLIPEYECVSDYNEDLLKTNISNKKNFSYYISETETEDSLKLCTDCDICIGTTKYNCTCNYKNNESQIFLGNVSNHYCQKLHYVNFAKGTVEKSINKIGGSQFTLHFWVFATSYVNKVFKGITVDWKGYTTIQVGLDSSGKYYFTCFINDNPTKKYIDFYMDQWNFLHCAVNYDYSKFYITTELKAYEIGFTFSEIPSSVYQKSTLYINDLTNVADWGYLFYRYIRLWSDAFRTSSFLSRINIKTHYFSDSLLYQWENLGYYSDYKIISTNDNNHLYVEYSSEKIGTNIVKEEIYEDIVIFEKYFCSDEGQYYDRKTLTCINFTDISNTEEEIIITNVDVAYSHNYGMAFWILFEDHQDITTALNFTWEYHMQISLQYVGSTFKAYCFPQNYKPYSTILEKDISLDDKTKEILNSATNEYTDDLSGIWSWFQCSLTYNNRYFYLNENQQTLKIETLYKEGNTEFKNDEPLGYFYNGITNDLSTLKIQVKGNINESHKKIYLRCFYLFKDFLPYNYNFKYMDLYKMKQKIFPPLTLAINFDQFSFPTGTNTKINIAYKTYKTTDNSETNRTLTLNFKDTTILELAPNFIFLPLCNPLTKEKYNSETQLCEEITDCDTTALNAEYCMEEATPLVCKTNFYINIDSSDNSVYCSNYCEDGEGYFRSPGTFETQGICGTNCLSNEVLKTCPNSASSILDYQSYFECKLGYNRIGYQCIQEPTNSLPNQGALFYSKGNHPYNIYNTFSEDLKDEIKSGYVLEFWFMIDNVIYTDFGNGKYHYFYADPHEVYLEKNNLLENRYYYKYFYKDTPYDITNLMHQYEWNKILIFVDIIEKYIKLIVNFDKANSTTFTDIDDNNIILENIAFCTKKGNTNASPNYIKYPSCVKDNIEWASAYYNNIRVWNILTSTIDTIQSFVNGIYKEHPQSLVLFYPLTIKYLDNNEMSNIMGNYEEHISFNCIKGSCTLYNKDNIIIYNYSTKFDWGILHKKKFVSIMNGLSIEPNNDANNCNEHCIRCYETNNISNCYECETGYVLQYKECKDARKLYFLKTPSGTSGASINFVTVNENNKDFCDLTSFTIVFWMKFFGVKYPTITEYCKILSFDSNTYLSFHRNTNNLVFRENSKDIFVDDKFRDYFGIWIPISIANYISNSINDIYPNMLTLSVNKIDIPYNNKDYALPSSGLKATELTLGYEIIALFAELSIYSKFIQGAYGRARSEQYLTDRFLYKSLTGTKPNDCLVVSSDLQSYVDLICAPDYSVNFIDSYYCKNDTKFFNPYDINNDEKPDSEKCGECNSDCLTLCYDSSEQNCTCDMTDGIYWLRRTGPPFNQTYCEHIYDLDFSNIEPYTYINTPVSKTREYTIEFWLYIYSYNQEVHQFKELYLEWNYHNKITIFDENQSLKVNCQPIWRSYDFPTTTYPDVRTNSLKYRDWNYVRCGTDLRNRKYFSNSNIEYTLKAKKDTFFDFDEIQRSSTSQLKYFKIYRIEDFEINFGFVFIREIKLWQQYNLDYLDSQYIYFDMNTLTKEELKNSFPGLFLYFRNEFNLTQEGNSVIREELSGTVTILPRSPGYLGYNIVDSYAKLNVYKLDICPYGKVYYAEESEPCKYPEGFDQESGEAVDQEIDALCEVYSNKNKQCFKCKDNNQFLNKWVDEFPEECYNECPATLYEDPLINQCRRCHETCYECTNEYYNNCTSCTGTLYFNFKENTCIPNCQTAGLTRSLTKKNICVVFDASAILVNVDELIPIDINTFYYIVSEVILPTSPEYETEWLFDVEKTNKINQELGFDDIISQDSTPFTGDITKLNVTLDHEFFKTEHKYVFGLKIYAENEGLSVDIYVWWTLTMNSPPYGGKLTIMPYLGLYNTTTFIMRCVDYEDENTPQEDLEYSFYYIEQNTNFRVNLTTEFSLNNEVYSNFTVRFYQLEYSNITIYCQVKDKWGAVSETSNVITIVNKKNSDLYILKQLVASFILVDDPLTDIQLLARSEVLMSLGINPYTDRVPSSYFTTYESSLTGEKVLNLEPQCVNGYCNDNGDCEVIDVALTCKCTASYMGKQCFLDKNGYSDLSSYYEKMYLRLQDRLNEVNATAINDIVFQAFYRLFFAAQNFFQNDSFFDINLIEFKTYLKNELNYITQDVDKLNKILDLDELFFNYFYVKETQTKLTTKINEGYNFRNKTLTEEESSEYQNEIDIFLKMIDEDTVFLIKNYGYDYTYTCQHFIYHIKRIDESFNDEQYFESLKTVLFSYKPTICFMDCLKQKYSSFNFYLNYIEYLVNPMSYDSSFYPNVTSPFVSIKIYDSNGKEIELKECPSSSPIKVSLPFHAYDWVNYINEQKWLFLPENYKLEDDPIFRDPILIWDNGSVSNDSVEERIAKYYRYYNIVGLVYTPNSPSLYEYTSFLFKNISDTFFLLFETSSLGTYSSMIIPNIMNFVVDGRFFYIKRFMVLLCYQNHISNPAFYIILALLLLFIFVCLVFRNKDYDYFDNLEDLQFLQKEIIKTKFDYNQVDPGLNDENIIKLIPHFDPNLSTNKRKQIRTMFDDYDVEGIEEINEDEKENENDNEENKSDDLKNANNKFSQGTSTTRRRLRNETKIEENDKDEREKETEIKTHKRRRHKDKTSKKNPPKRKGENKKYDGYGDGDDNDDDFDENKIEKNISSEKSTIKNKFRGTKQNFDLQTLNSKLGFYQTKFSKVSKFSNLSSQSKKSYYIDKDKTKANLISLQKFHDKSNKVNLNKDIPNKDEEQLKSLEEYTILSVSAYQFLKYNLRTRHILISPFLNLTLFNNRWKKLYVLLTQFYIQQLALSIILTAKEEIVLSNISGLILASLLSGIISNIFIYFIVFFFCTDMYERLKLYRLVMKGESIIIFKAWDRLKKIINIKTLIGVIICSIFWLMNIYISLIFTAVWRVQRNAWIVCFFLTIFIDLAIGEILIEALCAILYSNKRSFNFIRNVGHTLNRLRRYRTMWP